MSTLHEEVQKIIEEINPYAEINETTHLLEEGVLNSLEIFAFVTMLEDEYAIEVPDESITRENFATIDSIASFVGELLGKKCLRWW